MTKHDKKTELTEKQKIFCREYIFDWNASRSYKVAYPGCKTDDSARAASSLLLTKINIIDHIKEIQQDLERIAGISRLKVLNEQMNIAFSSIAYLHDDWITLAEFDKLTKEQKACIAEISTKKITEKHNIKLVEVDYVKIKLHDKTKALEQISKMLGYNEPDKLNINLKDKITGITFDE